jgi:NADPH:quinone reductase-like Zn-dependent oxidoreductase
MLRIVQDRTGGPETLRIVEQPDPVPREGQVLIRSSAAGVNPVDIAVRSGAFGILGAPPFTVGWDVAGRVVAVGPGVTEFAVGDRVFGMPLFPREAAAYSTHVLAPANEIAKTPAALSDAEAGALPLAGLTAWQCLVRIAGVVSGQKLLIHGGAGGVGHLAVQIGKARGAHVTATASAGKMEAVRRFGADVVLDYAGSPLGDGYDAVLDPQSGAQAERSVAAAKEGGAVVTLLPPPAGAHAAASVRNVTLTSHLVSPDAEGLRALAQLAELGQLRVHVARTFPLAEAGAAQRYLKEATFVGKVVLIP